jgi:hypothetical protein
MLRRPPIRALPSLRFGQASLGADRFIVVNRVYGIPYLSDTA